MSTTAIIVLVVVALLGLLLLAPRLARAYTRASATNRCAELQAQLATLTAQGAAWDQINQVQLQIEQCLQQAADAGSLVDLGAAGAKACLASRDRIRAEWGNLLQTSYSDILKRDNIRGAIHRLGREMALCLDRAVVDAATLESLKAVQSALNSALADSIERSTLYSAQANGTDRYFGSVEEAPLTKAAQERENVEAPLRAAEARLQAKKITLSVAAGGPGSPEARARAQGARDASAAFWTAQWQARIEAARLGRAAAVS